MHRVFTTPELVNEIVAYTADANGASIDHGVLDTHSPSSASRTTLAFLARTSSIFTASALDYLWATVGCDQDPLLLALRLLPSDCASFLLDSQGQIMGLVAERPLLESEWSRFLWYAKRVKIYNHDSSWNTAGRLGALTLIMSTLPASAVFPNLHGLSWRFSDEAEIHLFRFFLCGSVSGVRLKGDARCVIWATSLVAARSRRIVEYDAQYTDPSPLGVDILTRIVAKWTNLRMVHLPTYTADGLRQLGSSMTLSSLAIEGLAGSLQDLNVATGSFAALKHLSIGRLTLASASELVSSSRAFPLESLRLHRLRILAGDDTAQLATMFENIALHRLLELLHVQTDSPVEFSMPYDAVSRMRHEVITDCRITVEGGFSLQDNDLREWTMGLPALRRLELRQSVPRTRLTIAALLVIADEAPLVTDFGATMNVAEFPTLAHSGQVARRSLQRALVRLHVGLTEVRQPQKMSMFLGSLFPSLTFIEHDFGAGPTTRAGRQWKEVERWVEIIQDCRQEERDWMHVAAADT